MQKKRKIAFVLSILIMVFLCMSTVVFADNFELTQFENVSGGSADTAAQNIMGTAINVVRIVGTGIAIIMLSYIGIKYMMAAPAERADFKKSMSIYVVGAILVFGATQILGVIFNFADNVISTS